MPYLSSSSSSICLNPVHSPLSCNKVADTVTPNTDEDNWDACSSLHSPSTSQSVTVSNESEEPTSLRSNIIKWREGIPLGYPDNETSKYWELIGPLSSSPLFMTTSPTCTSFLTAPPTSPRHTSVVSFQCSAHISHSTAGSLLYNAKQQSQEDLEIRRISSGCSDDECPPSDCDTDCTVVTQEMISGFCRTCFLTSFG